MSFSRDDIEQIKPEIKKRLSEKRFIHSVSVSKVAMQLAQLCAPDLVIEAGLAGILHDITKELSLSEQMELIRNCAILLDDEDLETESIIHSFTAPAVIKRDFPKFATAEILSAVYKHTVGAADMSLLDEIIFVADFIEENRRYPVCVELRERVLSSMKPGDVEGNIKILHESALFELDSTVKSLLERGRAINKKTLLAKDAIFKRINSKG